MTTLLIIAIVILAGVLIIWAGIRHEARQPDAPPDQRCPVCQRPVLTPGRCTVCAWQGRSK